MEKEVREECLKRLKFIEGHLAGVRKMVEEGKYCVDILKQTFAVRRAIQKLESIILDKHLHTCVIRGIRDGLEDKVVGELVELYNLSEK